jgi:hypothetical protein
MRGWPLKVYVICDRNCIWVLNGPQADMVEYNQCQATLKTLYELGIPGKVEEFTAYRILMLLHGRNKSGTPFSSSPAFCHSDLILSSPFSLVFNIQS